jgi:hypothetical protein
MRRERLSLYFIWLTSQMLQRSDLEPDLNNNGEVSAQGMEGSYSGWELLSTHLRA